MFVLSKLNHMPYILRTEYTAGQALNLKGGKKNHL